MANSSVAASARMTLSRMSRRSSFCGQQPAATAILEVDDAAKPEQERRFSLPAGHAVALLDPGESVRDGGRLAFAGGPWRRAPRSGVGRLPALALTAINVHGIGPLKGVGD
jgi:hypothetical protein